MREVNGMKMYSHEDILEDLFGPVSSPEREDYEKGLELMYKRREAGLKAARERKRKKEEAQQHKLSKQMANNVTIVVSDQERTPTDYYDHIPVELMEKMIKGDRVTI